MNCPVCLKAGIPDDSKVCPQCDTDLTQFQLLDNIKKGQAQQKRAVTILVFCSIITLILLLIFLWIGPKTDFLIPLAQRKTKDSTLYYKSKLHDATYKIDSINAVHQICFTIYKVEKGDNLSKISEKFYGSDDRVNEIVKENSIDNPNLILVGQDLRIRIQK